MQAKEKQMSQKTRFSGSIKKMDHKICFTPLQTSFFFFLHQIYYK